MGKLREQATHHQSADFSSPPPSDLDFDLANHLANDRRLSVSPTPSYHLKSSVSSERPSMDNSSIFVDSRKDQCLASPLSDTMPAPKSSVELVKEIATLETEIAHLERYLLSLYRSAFQKHLPSSKSGSPATYQPQIMGTTTPRASADQLTGKLGHSPPSNGLVCSPDPVQSAPPKKKVYDRHQSLADHLGDTFMDYTLVHPDRLSEEMLRCMSLLYCKLANPKKSSPHKEKGYSISSNSSFCSSTTFSPRNLSGSWSPQCNEENFNFEGLKQDNGNGPYDEMVEVLKICCDDDSYKYAATMLQKFRSLVKNLEKVDLKKMRREEKLAFWINVHNALIMHIYLAYGTQTYVRNTSIMKEAYNVGGQLVNAYDIQSSILGIRPHFSAPWLQTILSPGKKFKTGSAKHVYAIEYPEPLVHFALSSGSFTDPMVRVYKATSIFHDLKVAKEEFIQASVYVHKDTKIYLPRILGYYAKDMSLNMAGLLEVVSGCSSEIQQKGIAGCVKGSRPEKHVFWVEQSSTFRYVIHKDVA